MQRQGLEAAKLFQSSYIHDVVEKNAQVLNKTYMVTDVAPLETKPKPEGLKLYEKWIKRTGGAEDLNSLVGWVNADLFVTGLKNAGPEFTRQKVVDAINQSKDYKAGGILAGVDWTTADQAASLLHVCQGRRRQVQAGVRRARQAVPLLPGRPQDNANEPGARRLTVGSVAATVPPRHRRRPRWFATWNTR